MTRARVGQFSLYQSSAYGTPVPVARPADNRVTPDPAQATADKNAAQLADLYTQLKNAQTSTKR